jgi:antitoxin component of RelBE/YafQ-DinJ toxin-antitoxin module
MNEKLETITIKIPKTVRRKLKERAERMGLNISAYVRMKLIELFKENKEDEK